MFNLYVSATTPNFRPDMGETLSIVANAMAESGFLPHSSLVPVLGYWQGESEHSVIVTLHNGYQWPWRYSNFARALNQECIMLVTDEDVSMVNDLPWQSMRRIATDAAHARNKGISGWTRNLASPSGHAFVPIDSDFPVATHSVAFISA